MLYVHKKDGGKEKKTSNANNQCYEQIEEYISAIPTHFCFIEIFPIYIIITGITNHQMIIMQIAQTEILFIDTIFSLYSLGY